MADEPVIEFCSECGKGLSAGDVYVWNSRAYCMSCIGVVSTRGADWRE